MALVALLAEGVDRNGQIGDGLDVGDQVALLAEGVDRNTTIAADILAALVALLAEGVDRNQHIRNAKPCGHTSPSSRRAWIEI